MRFDWLVSVVVDAPRYDWSIGATNENTIIGLVEGCNQSIHLTATGKYGRLPQNLALLAWWYALLWWTTLISEVQGIWDNQRSSFCRFRTNSRCKRQGTERWRYALLSSFHRSYQVHWSILMKTARFYRNFERETKNQNSLPNWGKQIGEMIDGYRTFIS